MRRDLLRDDDSGVVVRGAVVLDDSGAQFDGLADEVFAFQRRLKGDVAAAGELIELGWSNGMGSLYLGERRD